jgi:hypothetical protein
MLIAQEARSWGEGPFLGLVGPWGGNTGNPFKQVDESSVAESSVLATFQARGGAWVDQITFEYRSAQGTVRHIQGGNTNGPLSPVMNPAAVASRARDRDLGNVVLLSDVTILIEFT